MRCQRELVRKQRSSGEVRVDENDASRRMNVAAPLEIALKTFNLSGSGGIVLPDRITHSAYRMHIRLAVYHSGQELQTLNPFSHARYHRENPFAED